MKKASSRKAVALGLLFALAGVLGMATDAQALSIRVSQESSAGLGDFDANVLGAISPFSTALTTSGFYQYGAPVGASYNGQLNGGPNPVSNLSQVFLLGASDGLSLVVVHDQPNDGSGGSTQTQWNLSGDTSAFVLVDDPGESVAVSGGGTQFDSTKNWLPCCTDGYAIGSLDGSWTMLGQFLSPPTGISTWQATSASGSSVPLILDPGRRVRLEPVPQSIPEPSILLLMGGGLAALVGYTGKRQKE